MTCTGLIGSKVVQKLIDHGHDAVTGEGLHEVLKGASTVLDVSNSPSFADDDVMKFFTTATTNIIEAAKKAGVGHYVILSVVGSDRMTGSGYMRAKVAQEKLIADGPLASTGSAISLGAVGLALALLAGGAALATRRRRGRA